MRLIYFRSQNIILDENYENPLFLKPFLKEHAVNISFWKGRLLFSQLLGVVGNNYVNHMIGLARILAVSLLFSYEKIGSGHPLCIFPMKKKSFGRLW